MSKLKKISIPLLIISSIVAIVIIFDGDIIKKIFVLKPVRVVTQSEITRMEEELSELTSKSISNPEVINKIGVLYQNLGAKYNEREAWDPAIDALQKALGYGRNNPLVHYQLAIAYANRGSQLENKDDIDKAHIHYEKALQMDPNFTEAKYGLAILLFYEKENRQKAVQLMEEITKQKPTFYRARFALGRFYYENKDLNRSLSVYQDLYTDLEKLDSPLAKEYKQACKENIQRITAELAR
ncbi:MAG: tetratricopeptide repeat protein [Spirochaetes bacterium]|nr:tetratricopeptide repeat protein [Spirochaetota bacterium]